MTQTYEEAVLKTVMFWTEKSFETPINQNNGDDSEHGGMAFLLMNMVASKGQKTATPEKIKLFEQKLTDILISGQEDYYKRTLDVDYHPCEQLQEAADFAGIDSSCFPCKTFTRIEKDNSVVAKYQYGGKFITL